MSWFHNEYNKILSRFGVNQHVTKIPAWKAYQYTDKWVPTTVIKLKLTKLSVWSLLTFRNSSDAQDAMEEVEKKYEENLDKLVEKLNQGD